MTWRQLTIDDGENRLEGTGFSRACFWYCRPVQQRNTESGESRLKSRGFGVFLIPQVSTTGDVESGDRE